MIECTCPQWPDRSKGERHCPACPYLVLEVRLDVTAAVLLETAAFLLVCTSRAGWTDPAAFWLFAGSTLCWTVYGTHKLNQRLGWRT